MAKLKTDCTDPKGHVYMNSGHVAVCQNCNKKQVYNPKTRVWENP